MTSYVTIEDIINESVKNRPGSKTTHSVTQHKVYEECWQALNQWIYFCMRKRMGAEIGNFANFTWQFFNDENGEVRCRPYFMFVDTYRKHFRAQCKKPLRAPLLAQSEEINFSKLALRYSTILTRDMLFVGLRDIFRYIGEAILKGGEVKIEFAVGTLCSKERKTRFEFDPKCLSAVKNITDSPRIQQPKDKYAKEDQLKKVQAHFKEKGFIKTLDKEASKGASTEGYAVSRPTTTTASMPKKEIQVKPEEEAGASSASLEETQIDRYSKEQEPEMNEGIFGSTLSNNEDSAINNVNSSGSEVLPPIVDKIVEPKNIPLMDIKSKKKTANIQTAENHLLEKIKPDSARSKCIQDGYLRYFNELRKIADQDTSVQNIIETSWKTREEIEQFRAKQNELKRKEVQNTIKEQIAESDKKKQEAIKERRIHGQTTIRLRDHPELDDPLIFDTEKSAEFYNIKPKQVVVSKEDLRDSLFQQMQEKELKIKREKYRALEEEKRFLDHVDMEIAVQNDMKNKKREQKKEMLRNAWDLDRELRVLEREMERKIKTGKPLKELFAPPSARVSARSELANNAVGVGFDPRN